jgi:hypothetical protein
LVCSVNGNTYIILVCSVNGNTYIYNIGMFCEW